MTREVDEELYSGLRTQDLQEAKDQLLVETADMLHTPLFTAEALLRDNEHLPQTSMNQSNYAGVDPQEGNLDTLIQVSCNICCEVVPLWKRPTRVMTCEVRF